MEKKDKQAKSSKYEFLLLVAEISSALWVHIQIFETTLRNFLSEFLTNTSGQVDWWNTTNYFYAKENSIIDEIKTRLKHSNLDTNSKNVISNLGFSFWIELLSKRYHQKIWMKLVKFFPAYPGRREDFYNKAREIRNLRNVIAHHGPILRRDLFRDHAYLHELTALLDPELANEVKRKSRVLDLLLNARLVGSGGGI